MGINDNSLKDYRHILTAKTLKEITMTIAILNQLYDRRMERLRAKRLARAEAAEERRMNDLCNFLELVFLCGCAIPVALWITGG